MLETTWMAGVYVWCRQNNKGKRSTGHQLIVLMPEKIKGGNIQTNPRREGYVTRSDNRGNKVFHG